MEHNFTDFSQQVIDLIKIIPLGTVATYGQIAREAGFPRGARQVVRLLHSSSHTKNLPWHRVIDRRGMISLPRGGGFEEQYSLLTSEGIIVEQDGHVSLTLYQCSFSSLLSLSHNLISVSK